MKPQRSDRFKNWYLKNEHACQLGELVNQMTLEETMKHFFPHREEITEEMINQDLARFTGKHNLSRDVLSSHEFYLIA